MPNIPKWLVNGLGAVLLIFVALLIVDKGSALNEKLTNRKPNNTISISAEGKVAAVPDMAIVNVGVLTQGPTQVAVKDENNKKVNQIVEFIKKQGVAKEDINTAQFYFYPQYDWQGGKSTINGYQGNQVITVKVYGIDKSQDKLNKILDGVVNQGANEIQGVQFSFKDPDDLRQQARKKAIAKAKEKAEDLAREAGLRLGRVVSISESSGYYPPIPMAYDRGAQAGYGGGSADIRSIAPTIEPGRTDITENMTVVFEVK